MPEVRIGDDAQVAVVGAGLAGLTAAYRLQQAGVDVALFEANPERIGGRCWTERSFFAGGMTAEHGAERIDTRHREIRDLAAELGLELYDHLAGQEPGALVLAKMTFAEGERSSAESVVHDALLADMARRGITLGGPPPDDELTDAEAALDAISVREWIEANLDGGLASPAGKAFGTMIALSKGRELDDLSAHILVTGYDSLLGYLAGEVDYEHVERAADVRYQVRGGNGRIPDELASRLSPGVLTLGAKLTRLARVGDDRYQLDFASGISVSAPAVIVALPSTSLRDVDLTNAGVSDDKLAAIEELDLALLTKISMQFDRPLSEFPDWDGLVSSEDPRLVALCTSGGQAGDSMIVTVFCTGDDCRALSNGVAHGPASDAVVTPLLDVIDSAVPGIKAAFNGRAWMDSWVDSEYIFGSYSSFRPGQTTRFAPVVATPEAGIFFAGEHTSTKYRVYMNGAVESGERAAREVLAHLAERSPCQ
jgi:monoamine oxidase